MAVAAHAAVATPLSLAAAVPAASVSESSTSVRSFAGLRPVSGGFSVKAPEWRSKTVSNGSRLNCMQVVDPYDNIHFETLSYTPPLTDDAIIKQVDYLLRKGWFPCLEFCKIGTVYRKHLNVSGYYDGRYWTMWKLPMFGCNDSAQVLIEINECKKAYPNDYIRILGFDQKRQVQCCGFLVQKPEIA